MMLSIDTVILFILGFISGFSIRSAIQLYWNRRFIDKDDIRHIISKIKEL